MRKEEPAHGHVQPVPFLKNRRRAWLLAIPMTTMAKVTSPKVAEKEPSIHAGSPSNNM
ncbi:MAG: hypothetical protein IPH00_15860 [Flavobacteriales bacterium]|nr:hypothetical protein [Flavobacteriales bacterium]